MSDAHYVISSHNLIHSRRRSTSSMSSNVCAVPRPLLEARLRHSIQIVCESWEFQRAELMEHHAALRSLRECHANAPVARARGLVSIALARKASGLHRTPSGRGQPAHLPALSSSQQATAGPASPLACSQLLAASHRWASQPTCLLSAPRSKPPLLSLGLGVRDPIRRGDASFELIACPNRVLFVNPTGLRSR